MELLPLGRNTGILLKLWFQPLAAEISEASTREATEKHIIALALCQMPEKFSRREIFWDGNTYWPPGSVQALHKQTDGRIYPNSISNSVLTFELEKKKKVSKAHPHSSPRIIWDQWLLWGGGKKNLCSLRGEIMFERWVASHFRLHKRPQCLKAQLWRKFADMSERDNYLEGGECFVIINIDLRTPTCGRSSYSDWSVPGHMCWGHARWLRDQRSSSLSESHLIYLRLEPGSHNLLNCSPKLPVEQI